MATEDPLADPSLRADVASIADRPRARVLVVGGGVNGIATFRDLALQGVDVVLVERGDYCSGASAASSHMIHGGVRYLENGEFRLVKESVQERNRLLKLAPHYVKPLPTTIPIFSTFSGILAAPLRFLTHTQRGRPKERGALLIKLGLLGYDSFSRDGGTVPRHEFFGRTKSLARMPQLRPDVKYTARYFDAAVENPERLALDLLGDALATGNARSANYVEAVGTRGDEVVLRDTVSGREFAIAADVVVNTTGPWTDLTNSALGRPSRFMGGTKGSHVVLDNPELYAACAGGEVFFENGDGRIVLVYPLNGKVLVGTTDLEADPAAPAVCTEEEVDYFFALVSHVFPGIPVDRSQIVYRYAGIRPLPRHDDTAPGFVSRDYRIEHGTLTGGAADAGAGGAAGNAGGAAAGGAGGAGAAAVPLVSLVGGKWTTFRALAEHLGNEVLELLGLSRSVSTEKLAIGGGVGFPLDAPATDAWVGRHSSPVVPADRVRILLARYGTKATALIEALAASGERELAAVPGFSAEELGYLVAEEHVVHLDDLMLRRTNLAFVGGLNPAAFEELAAVVALTLGWTAAELADEKRRAASLLASQHALDSLELQK